MSQELDTSMFTAEAVAELFSQSNDELDAAVTRAMHEAMEDSEVQAAFRSLFTEEELAELKAGDRAEVAAQLRAALAGDPAFQEGVLEGMSEWLSTVEISVPEDERGVDDLITTWQIPTEETPA
jgi:hypothetical protein